MGTGHHAASPPSGSSSWPPSHPGRTREGVRRNERRQRGAEALERVRGLADGFGVHSVLERVGLAQSMLTTLRITRPGGAVGRVAAGVL